MPEALVREIVRSDRKVFMKEQDWSPFSAQDPFNVNNFVEGLICHAHGDSYGALQILRVNHKDIPQLILCTPKLAYPFDKSGNWHFPKAKSIERYEKLDGTNIFAYQYHDAEGTGYVSFKTRLLPFVGNSRFGPFADMVNGILSQRPQLRRLPLLAGMNLSFELWGARNAHLVRYEKPLELSLLFARKDGRIIPPSAIHLDLLAATFRGLVDGEYVASYKASQVELEGRLKETEDGYSGMEGEVWYLLDETGTWNLYKCKPETIEKIHWSAGGLGKNIILATIENAFENWDEPTVDQIKQLLLEEFQPAEVENAHYSIVKHLPEVIAKHQFKETVLVAYRTLGMNILTHKADVMRALSSQFDRKDMKRVYAHIWASEAK